jgi:hypothetical protein
MWVCRLVFKFCLIAVSLSGSSAKGQIGDELNRIVKDSTLYLITVGNPSKTHLIAKQFSGRDTVSTHVGFVIRQEGKPVIIHVTDIDPSRSALRMEVLDNFLNASRFHYVSLWRVILSNDDFVKVRDRLDSTNGTHVTFDYDFDLTNGNSLYCSEFCAGVLNDVDIDGIGFVPEQRRLSEFYQKVLKRDVLSYYPVDFFQSSSRIVKLVEHFR